MASDSEKAQAAASSGRASAAEPEDGVAIVLDAETNKKLLRRIDWYVTPRGSYPLRARPGERKGMKVTIAMRR